MRTFSGHSQGISDIAWSPDNAFIASASDDKTIRIWDVDAVSWLIEWQKLLFLQLYGIGYNCKDSPGAYGVRILRELQPVFNNVGLWGIWWNNSNMGRCRRYSQWYFSYFVLNFAFREIHESYPRSLRPCDSGLLQHWWISHRILFNGQPNVCTTLLLFHFQLLKSTDVYGMRPPGSVYGR